MTAAQMFEQTYKKSAQYTAFTPYRICPIGAHSDHQLGKITGFAIDKGIHIAYGPKENGVIEIKSMQFDKRAQWHVAATPETSDEYITLIDEYRFDREFYLERAKNCFCFLKDLQKIKSAVESILLDYCGRHNASLQNDNLNLIQNRLKMALKRCGRI